MARILVNYIYNKAKDEFKLLENDFVYADQKIAILETEEEIKKPLIVQIRNEMVVVDREKYELTNKKFHLAVDKDGKVFENENGFDIWLPKETDISKLRVINNKLVMVEEEQKKTQPKKVIEKEK